MRGVIAKQLRVAAGGDRKRYRELKRFLKKPSAAPGGRNIVREDKEV